MNAQELKSKITDKNIVELLKKMNAVIFEETSDVVVSSTVCHHGDSPKLYYYKDSEHNRNKYESVNLFHCYTGCSDSFDLIELVCRNKGYKFREAIDWICIQLGFSTIQEGFGNQNVLISDWDFINHIKGKKKVNVCKSKDYYDKNILNIFQPMYCREWIDEGIDVKSMIKYGVSYCTLQQKIIIPHYDIEGNLMGIRGRTTDEEEAETYGKYTPFYIGGIRYSHPLSQNLYGLYINKDTIRKKRKIMLVEAEKSVQQCDSIFGEDNFTVGLCGSSFSNYQRDLILSLGVREVIIALDKQYRSPDDEDAKKWEKHIQEKFIKKLSPYCIVTILWDTENLLPYKASPTDCGGETLLKLMDNKIYAGYA